MHAQIIGEVLAVTQLDPGRQRITIGIRKASGINRDHINLLPKDWRGTPATVQVGERVALVGTTYPYQRQDGSDSTGLRDVVLVTVNQ